MPIQKRSQPFVFSKGIDTKTDPFQLPIGQLLALENVVFNTGASIQKRNGFGQITNLNDDTVTSLSTFSGGLVAIGNSVQAYNGDTGIWYNQGSYQQCDLSVVPVIRNSASQSKVDSVVAENGIACTVYNDSVAGNSYIVHDSVTSQVVLGPVTLPATATNPRVFLLGSWFIISFVATVGTSCLQYIAVSTSNPVSGGVAVSVATNVKTLGAGYDGVVANNRLYFSWNASDGGGAIRTTFITATLAQSNTVANAGVNGDIISLAADITGSSPVIWTTWYDSALNILRTHAYDQAMVTVLANTTVATSVTLRTVTSVAQDMVMTAFYENIQNYGFSGGVASDTVSQNTVTQTGAVGTPSIICRGVGLASKAFIFSPNNKVYMLVVYAGTYQPTLFLMDSSGNIVAKFCYQNSAGYASSFVLPQANISGYNVIIAYLFKDLIQPVNKNVNPTSVAGLYIQTGINLVNFVIKDNVAKTSEIGGGLHLTGGFLWLYDGYKPVEHNFFLYPEDFTVTGSGTGGTMTAQQYYYAVTYEWTDGAGNIHRSAPSVPLSVTTTGTTSSVTLNIPTLRLTYKTSSKVRICIYRWSAGQQVFYQVTSLTSPTLNNVSVDYITYVDTVPDSSIIGNLPLYTTGGIVENIGLPAVSTCTLFGSRLFAVSAEDPNLVYFSKQVIEGTPVEASDLFSIYSAPTVGSQINLGPITALFAMDDKLLIFRDQSISYVTGIGPDNTGASNDYRDPVFITGTVGCNNQQSLVLTPDGVMFQSADKGIWLLGRDLGTTYIGAPVEGFNSSAVLSAVTVPNTNHVRFTLSNNITLMYDYYYGQWGTFVGVPAIASTLYQSLHTFINTYGGVYQETPGEYLDGSNPVLMSFRTGWLNMAGLQGFERAYWFYLLGSYVSPHKLNLSIAYDYNSTPLQNTTITPDNYVPAYGGDPLYGDSQYYGGPGIIEQWRIFFKKQKCQSFQITLQEQFDSSYGVAPGQGLSISGLNVIFGAKGNYPRLSAARTVG